MLPTIIVYGATSYTAYQFLQYIQSHPDADAFEVILAGRNRAKLVELANKLDKDWNVQAVELSDQEAVKNLVQMGSVVVNFAGTQHATGRPSMLTYSGPYRWHNAEALIK
jgi:short subunit dehydrogenase-like uncharacterized protein